MNFPYRLSATLIGAAIVLVQPQIALPQTVDEQAISSMAKDVTVIINGQNPGSGVIISQQGNTYYILTAKHVVATQDEYEIITSDGIKHALDYRTLKKLPNVDLALVQFTSNQSYRVAQLGNSESATEGTVIYTAGWPHPGRAITERIYQMTKGSISGRSPKPLEGGYALIYTNITKSGMSGGPVLDAEGRVIGIHGRAEGEPVYNPDTGATVDVKSGFNLGIPINSFLKLASQTGINLSYTGDNFTLAKVLSGHSGGVVSVAISPDGQTIASGSYDKTIKIWHRSTGKELRTLTGHSEVVLCLAISRDGQTLASGSYDGTIKIWNLHTGQLLHTLTGYPAGANPVLFPLNSVVFSPNGQTLVSSWGGIIKIWNLPTGELLRTLKGHTGVVNSVAFSPDGQTIASGSQDRTIKIWNLGTGELVRTLTGHSDSVEAVAINPYGQILASGSDGDDATIKIWNRSTGELLHTLKGHAAKVSGLAIDPYGHILASGSYDGTIKMWNLYTGKELRTLEARGDWVYSVAFSGDGQTLISSSHDRKIKIWQVVKP